MDLIKEADELVYGIVMSMATESPNLLLAVKKLRPRVVQASELVKKTASKKPAQPEKPQQASPSSSAPQQASPIATEEEIGKIVMISDLLLREIGEISMEPSNKYDWEILDFMHDADKLAYNIIDRLSSSDSNLKLAMRKLRPRVTQAAQLARQTVTKLQKHDIEQIEQL